MSDILLVMHDTFKWRKMLRGEVCKYLVYYSARFIQNRVPRLQQTIFDYLQSDEEKKKEEKWRKRRDVSKEITNANGEWRGERERKRKTEKNECKKRKDESKNTIMTMESDEEKGEEERRLRRITVWRGPKARIKQWKCRTMKGKVREQGSRDKGMYRRRKNEVRVQRERKDNYRNWRGGAWT